jgi:O-acetyl-ADP-ribose deacetylase (regulator of RNase III)
MITYRIGDATAPFGPPEERKIIVHVCNDYGGWGRGFVLALSSRWHDPERAYRSVKHLKLGTIQIVPVSFRICVVNMIAQHGNSTPTVPAIQYDALKQCLQNVHSGMQLYQLLDQSIHMPRIGCGLGGGEWEKVEQIINEVFPPETNINVYDMGAK